MSIKGKARTAWDRYCDQFVFPAAIRGCPVCYREWRAERHAAGVAKRTHRAPARRK